MAVINPYLAHQLPQQAEKNIEPCTVADPGFPVGRRGSRTEAWTPKTVTFQKFCMSKRKNLDP